MQLYFVDSALAILIVHFLDSNVLHNELDTGIASGLRRKPYAAKGARSNNLDALVGILRGKHDAL